MFSVKLKCYVGSNLLLLSCQTQKLMAATKFSDYRGVKHYKKEKKRFNHSGLANCPQSYITYHTISLTVNSGNQLKMF
jgi:hypothetical protein